MEQLTYFGGFPFLADGPTTGFRVRDCMVYRLVDGAETEAWDHWNPAAPAPPGFPTPWVRAVWQQIQAAPRTVLREDQWCSAFASLLGDMVIHWFDDRQQGDCRLASCTPLAEHLRRHPLLDEASFRAALRLPR
jgi:hypothetical protein